MKILVVGGTGFIGRNLCHSLASDHDVSVFARHYPTTEDQHITLRNTNILLGDVAQALSIRDACKGMDCIAYLASTVIPSTSNRDPVFDIQSNLVGAVNTLEAAIFYNVPKVIFLSSGGTIYGDSSDTGFKESCPTNPICSYGIIKLAIEKYISMYHKLHGLSYSILRLSNPYGPGYTPDKPQGVIDFFMHRLLNNKEIVVWGDGSIERDFIYIKDVVIAIQKAIESKSPSLLLNIGTSVPTSINRVIDLLGSALAKTPLIRYEPSRLFDVRKSVLDITAAKSELHWSPQISLEDGIRLMVESNHA